MLIKMKKIIKTNFVDKNQVTVVKIHKFRGQYIQLQT